MNVVLVRKNGGLKITNLSTPHEMSRRYNRSDVNATWWETVDETHGFQRLDQQPFVIRNVRLEGVLSTTSKEAERAREAGRPSRRLCSVAISDYTPRPSHQNADQTS